MGFAGLADCAAIEAEGPWEGRDVARTTWDVLNRTAARAPDRPAVTFQMFSDPRAPSETRTWREVHG